MLSIRPAVARRNLSAAARALVKAIVAAVATVLTPEPISAAAMGSKALPSLVDVAFALMEKKDLPLGAQAWEIIRAAYSFALVRFFSTISLGRQPGSAELETLIESLLNRADILADQSSQLIGAEHLMSPLKIRVLRDFARAIPHELIPFSPKATPDELRRYFEECANEGLSAVRDQRPDIFRRVVEALSGPFSRIEENHAAVARHHQFLIRGFSQASVFGQEATGITLSDLYVRQRCLWSVPQDGSSSAAVAADEKYEESTRPRPRPNKVAIGDLHKLVTKWLADRSPKDNVRVVAGGPGSGKSTFARALAIEVADANEYDVLFVPLQELENLGSFETRVGNLFRTRAELGFDRVGTPLNWMGVSEFDGRAPERPLLLICDGLDELAAPDTQEATRVTADFIQTLSNWLSQKNSIGCAVKAIILGRTIAAEEAFRRLDIDLPALLRVAGFLPVSETNEWRVAHEARLTTDPERVSSLDQRTVYWQKWCLAYYGEEKETPVALRESTGSNGGFVELTAEPLLLYLLIWTGFLEQRWQEAAENRNVVYLEMFRRIYRREWGIDKHDTPSGQPKGGHTTLAGLSEDDFFALQEVLGLASWTTGGRTVSKDAYNLVLEDYLDADKRDDLKSLSGSSLKSVALQSYTRDTGGGDDGYEFVHKTLGEYLIARALAQTGLVAVESLRTRASESRARSAAEKISKIYSIGTLTPEIDRFLADEIRLRFATMKEPKRILTSQLLPIVEWVLSSGAPVHSIRLPERAGFNWLWRLHVRTLDVLWSFLQHLSRAVFTSLSGDLVDSGPDTRILKIKWPSATSFSSMLAAFSDTTVMRDTKRLCSFDFIDLQGQAVTEQDFGGVLYDFTVNHTSPQNWIPISMQGVRYFDAPFFAAHLRSADFRGSQLKDCEFTGAQLGGANFSDCDLVSSVFNEAALGRAKFDNAILDGSSFVGSFLEGTSFLGASLVKAGFETSAELDEDAAHRLFTVNQAVGCDFARVRAAKVNLGSVSWIDCKFVGADLTEAVLADSSFDRCDFTDATLDGAVVIDQQVDTMGLTEKQKKQLKVMSWTEFQRTKELGPTPNSRNVRSSRSRATRRRR